MNIFIIQDCGILKRKIQRNMKMISAEVQGHQGQHIKIKGCSYFNVQISKIT